jgi:hypothetical protein
MVFDDWGHGEDSTGKLWFPFNLLAAGEER